MRQGGSGTGRGGRVLAVDVGNTSTRVGLLEAYGPDGSPEVLGSCELSTPARLTADDARVRLAQARSLLPACQADGAILSCVVPTLTRPWREALAGASAGRPLVVGPGLRSGMPMRLDDPSEAGSDRVADAVAARDAYGAPVVVVDLGTTTNIEVVDATGALAGGVIAPGVELGARSLAAAAARLPVIELRAPESAIGRNTRAAMRSGVVLGEAARIDGLLDAVLAELGGGDGVPVVVTGDDAADVAALLRHETVVDEALVLRGLALLWRSNRR